MSTGIWVALTTILSPCVAWFTGQVWADRNRNLRRSCCCWIVAWIGAITSAAGLMWSYVVVVTFMLNRYHLTGPHQLNSLLDQAYLCGSIMAIALICTLILRSYVGRWRRCRIARSQHGGWKMYWETYSQYLELPAFPPALLNLGGILQPRRNHFQTTIIRIGLVALYITLFGGIVVAVMLMRWSLRLWINHFERQEPPIAFGTHVL